MSDDQPPETIGIAELRRLRHDLRSRLVVIGGFARLLVERRDLTDDERADYAQRIERAAEEMRRTLDETIG